MLASVRQKTPLTVAGIVLCLVLIGLGREAVASESLEGTWETGWDDQVIGYFHKFSRIIHGNEVIAREQTLMGMPSRGFYLFDVDLHYKFTVGALLRTEGTKKIFAFDLISDRAIMTPRTASAAGIFWQTQECGVLNWTINQPIDVTGKICRTLTKDGKPYFVRGIKSYASVQIDGNQLQFSRDAIDSPAQRPVAMLPEIYIRKTP